MDSRSQGSRVLLVAPQPFFEERGTPIAVLHVLEALTELGYEVDLLTFPMGQPIDLPGVRILRVANPLRIRSVPIGFSLRKAFFDVLMWLALRRLLRRERYDYIHAVEEGAWLATLARGSATRVPIVYDMASRLSEQLEPHPVLGIRPVHALIRRLERRIVRSVAGVVCSAGLESQVEEEAPGTPCWRWIFPSGLAHPDPAEARALREELGIPDDAVVVSYVGSFAEYQGVGLLVEAIPAVLRETPQAFFVMVGAQSEAHGDELLERLPRDLRDRALVLPRVKKSRVALFLELSDVLVSLRKYGRNAPLKVFDYMAMRRAIVATDIPAHRAILDERLALLVEPEAEALAEGIGRILRDEELREGLASAAHAYAEEALSWPSFVDRIRAIAETTGGGRSARSAGSVEGRAGAADPARLSVCYVVPGSHFDPVAGPSRNAIELGRALGRFVDVTVAFRSVPPGLAYEGIELAAIDTDAVRSRRPGDDSAISGMGYWEFAGYLRSLKRFLERELPRHDVLLEKTWLLSGYSCSVARRLGVPAVPVENFVAVPGKGTRRGPMAYLRQAAGRFLAGRLMRRAPLIVAETEHLKRAMQSAWKLPPDRFRVIGVGVDRNRFRPADQQAARRELAIPADALVLLYVGILDANHHLLPAIDAFVDAPREAMELHVVGNGPGRAECERRAALGAGSDGRARVRFHGTVPHEEVPLHIAASDLCLAPYNAAAFPDGQVAYSILKIREYLSGGRAVASIPSGTIQELVVDGETGFLFENEVGRWKAFLSPPPGRERLRAMGEAAARTDLPTWQDVGRAVHGVLEEAVGAARSAAR